MRKLFIALLLLLAGAVTATLAYAPYLPQLVAEGVPPLTWPAAGHFATITGDPTPRDLAITDVATTRPMFPDLKAAFAETGGKALLVAHAGRLELEHYAPGITAETRFNSSRWPKASSARWSTRRSPRAGSEASTRPSANSCPTTAASPASPCARCC